MALQPFAIPSSSRPSALNTEKKVSLRFENKAVRRKSRQPPEVLIIAKAKER